MLWGSYGRIMVQVLLHFSWLVGDGELLFSHLVCWVLLQVSAVVVMDF